MAQNLISALGAGSGVDVAKLAKDLVEAARAPQKQLLDDKMAKADARISGYSVIQYALTEIRSAFTALKDASSFNILKATNTQDDAFSVTASEDALAGNYGIEVLALYTAQRSLSDGFAAADEDLGQLPITLTLQRGNSSLGIAVTDSTPEGIVQAINDAGAGITAELVNVGGASPWRIVVTGEQGADNAFTLTSDLDASVLNFSTTLTAASDAQISINGLTYERESNSIDDIISGVTLELKALTSDEARVSLTRDTSALTEKMRTLVSVYNDFEESLDVLRDRNSDVEGFGGALAGDSLVEQVRRQVQGFLRTTIDTDSAIQSPRDLGLYFIEGRLTFDESKWSTALTTGFDGVVNLMTGSGDEDGISATAIDDLDALLDSRTGLIAQQKTSTQSRIAGYEERLERLESQMEKLLERYTRQFSLMETIVGNSSSLRESLKGTFEGLAAMYTRR
jgi:flagellar hook-associated protein 2